MTNEQIKEKVQLFMQQWNENNYNNYITIWSEHATSVDDIMSDYILRLVEDDDTKPADADLDEWVEENRNKWRDRAAEIYNSMQE